MKLRAFFGWAWLCFACAGTETDNPVVDRDDDPVEYTSPRDFDAPTGGSSGSGCDPFEPVGGFVWHRAENLLIGADRFHGLVTIDISDPQTPKLLGELAFEDDLLVYQVELLFEEGEPREAVLAARATPRIASNELPEAGDFESFDQILRVDLSDPAEPKMIENWALEGMFRGLVVDDELAWVTTSYDSQDSEVPPCPFVSRCYTPDTLRVEGFRITDDGWEPVSEVELPAASRAWLSEEGVVGLQFAGSGSVLHFARFDGAAIGAPMSVTVDDAFGGRSLQMRLTTEELQVVAQIQPEGDRMLKLFRFGLSEEGPGEPEVTDLGGSEYSGTSGAFFAGDHLFVNLGRDNLEARVFELAESGTNELDLGAPTQVVLPLAELQASGDSEPDLVGAAPTKALAWRGDAGAVAGALSLVSIDGTDVTTLDDWEIPSESLIEANIEGYQEQLGFLQPHQVTLHGSYLTAHDQGSRGRLSALRIEGDALVSVGSVETDFVSAELAAGDDYFLVTPFGVVQTASFESGETSDHRYTDEVFLHTVVGGFEARLLRVEPYPRSRFELRLTRGDESWSFPMEHQPLALLPSDEALILPVLDPTCEEEDDDCVPQEPHLLTVSLTDPPRLLDPVVMPRVLDELTVVTAEAELSWLMDEDHPLLRLDDGRWVFTAEVFQACNSEAQCQELGAEARFYESEGYWRGVLRTRYLFALDVHQDGGDFSEPATSATGDDFTGFGQTLVSDGQLLVQRLQGIEPEDRPRQVRVFLDRFGIDDAGEFARLPRVNIPGRAIGVLEGGQLLTVEPRPGTGGGGTVHRVRVDDDAARVEDSLEIDGSFVSLHLESDTAVYVSEPSELCGGPRVLSTLSLSPKLELTSQLTLGDDWVEWSVAQLALPHVLLERQYGGHFALFELDDDGELELRSVRPSRCESYGPVAFVGEQLSCAAGGFGVERVEF